MDLLTKIRDCRLIRFILIYYLLFHQLMVILAFDLWTYNIFIWLNETRPANKNCSGRNKLKSIIRHFLMIWAYAPLRFSKRMTTPITVWMRKSKRIHICLMKNKNQKFPKKQPKNQKYLIEFSPHLTIINKFLKTSSPNPS